MNPLTILLTGAGAPGAPSIIQALRANDGREIRIIGVDVNERASGSALVDKFYLGPKFDSPTFVEEMLAICADAGVDVIHPIVTRELSTYAKNRDLFKEHGVTVCVMDAETLDKANSKAELLSTMSEAGVHTPAFKYASDPEEFAVAVHELGYPDKPVCFKPSVSNGSRGFRIFDPNVNKYDLLFNMKPNTTHGDYEDILDTLRSAPSIPQLIVMEYLPGAEYSVDILADHGKALVTIPRKRLKTNGGISTDCITEDNQEIIKYCEDIVACMGLHGNIGIQVKYDVSDIPQILEINPRLQGSIENCVAAGVNLPYLGVKLHLGEEIPEQNPKFGIEMVRRWEAIFFDQDGHAFTL